MSAGLRVATTFIGVALCALSIMLNFQLYSSLTGSSNLEQFSYQYIGVSLDFAKIVCLLLAVYFWFKAPGAKSVLIGTFCFFFYVVLSGISLSAGWGFGLNATKHGEDERLAGSYTMKAFEGQIEAGKQQAQNYSMYAEIDVTSLNENQQKIINELDNQKKKLASCPRNYFTKCINPARAEISRLTNLLGDVSVQLKGHMNYQGGLSQQNTAAMQIGQLDGSQMATQVFHPLFIAMGDLFLVTPREAKQTLLLISFVVLELLGSLFFTIGLVSGDTHSNGGRPFEMGHDGYSSSSASGSKRQRSNRARGNPTTAKANQPVVMSDQTVPNSELEKEESDQPVVKSDQPVLARADSDVEGENATRFEAIKSAILTHQIKPTLAGIQGFKHGGIGCNRIVAKRFQQALLGENLIEPYPLNNGKISYRMAGGPTIVKKRKIA